MHLVSTTASCKASKTFLVQIICRFDAHFSWNLTVGLCSIAQHLLINFITLVLEGVRISDKVERSGRAVELPCIDSDIGAYKVDR